VYKVLLASRADFMDIAAEIPYMFKRAGCEVHVFCRSNSTLLSNSYFDKWLESPEDEKEFQKQLIDIAENKDFQYDWIVPVDDEINKTMNLCIESEDIFKKILPLTKPENRELLSSKMGLSKICERYSIASPRYINYSDLPEIERVKQRLNFPVLLKEDFSFSGLGIQYCETKEMFETYMEKVRVKDNLVIQEFIKGDDIGVEALFKDGELVTYNYAEVLSYMYSKFSFTTKRTYSRNKEMEALLIRMGRCLGLNGFASVGYIYQPEQKVYYLIEVDVRVNSWMPYGRFTGGDFSEGIKRILDPEAAKAPNPDAKFPADKKVEVAIFDRDMRRCIKFKDFKGLAGWLFNYKGYWRFIPTYDKKLLKKILKKMYYDLFKIKY